MFPNTPTGGLCLVATMVLPKWRLRPVIFPLLTAISLREGWVRKGPIGIAESGGRSNHCVPLQWGVSPGGRFRCYSGSIGDRQCAFRRRKDEFVFNSGVLSVNGGQFADGLPKSACLSRWQISLIESLNSKGINLSVQSVRRPMVIFKCF
jgi:hypothetical protein